ncbi:MAG: PEP-CTERM sorting domain-containing protein [Acetobacteraceae bacterium]
MSLADRDLSGRYPLDEGNIFMLLRTSATVGLSAAALSLMAFAAQATPLPVQNLTFSDYSGAAPKDYFSTVDPAGWFRGPVVGDDLVFINAPGTATEYGGGPNSYPVYGPFLNPPPGGNFVQADGNPMYESSFEQVINGLVVGETYSLSFWQAAGQQQGFSGATTEQWKVFFGSTGGFSVDCSTNPCTTSVSGDTVEYDSTLMHTPSQGVSAWNLVSLNLVATAASETLGFLAWGDNGSTTNLPPTVFLAGVNTPAVPEPATLSLLGVGILGLGAVGLRRRAKRTDKV